MRSARSPEDLTPMSAIGGDTENLWVVGKKGTILRRRLQPARP